MADTIVYSYFNKIIASTIALPELAEFPDSAVTPDITFINLDSSAVDHSSLNWIHHWRSKNDTILLSLAKKQELYFLYFPGLAIFEINLTQKHILCHPQQIIAPATIRHLLLDQVLPRYFAHFSTQTVLHCSSVIIGKKAICFLGESGRGKSTIASGFVQAGFPLLADDCLEITVQSSGTISATANYTGLRLLPDSIQAIQNPAANTLDPVAHYTTKKRVNLPGAELESYPVAAFFILELPQDTHSGKQSSISTMSKSEAMKALLENSMVLDLNNQQYLRRQFNNLTTIIGGCPNFYLIRYPREYDQLPIVIKTIEQFLNNSTTVSEKS